MSAPILAQKIRHYLITTMGLLAHEASDRQFFKALSYALREDVMINWRATEKTIDANQPRQLYFISMEYLPGRLLTNNISNLHAHEVVKEAVTLLKRDYRKILTLEPDPGLGNGGLGRLSSCLLDSLATQKYPVTAYGLRYQYGIFEQELWDGVQLEKPDCWLLNENPWDLRKDEHAQIVKFAGHIKNRLNGQKENVMDLVDYEEVRALPFDFPVIGYSEKKDYNVATLRLWSTKESPHNFQLQRYNAGQIGPAAENTALTDVLYPNDNHDTGKRIRLKQEFLLVSASLQDIFRRHLLIYPSFENFADKVRIQINDTHPSLVIIELMRLLTTHHNFTWEKAFETVQAVVSYTNHTIMGEALEEWNQDRLRYLLPRQYLLIEKLNLEFCDKVRARYPGDEKKVSRVSMIEGGQVKMAHLAIVGSHKVNGVAKLHGEILKNRLFKDFSEIYPAKFLYVTNGVTQRHWLWHCNPILAQFITMRIGKGWITDFPLLRNLQNFASEKSSQEAFLDIKKRNKERLIQFLKTENLVRDLYGQPGLPIGDIALDSLFDIQAKRVHEYKRQLMNALNLIMIYHDLLDDVTSRKIKRTSIFGGKAAAGYVTAKNVIQLIFLISRKVNDNPALQGKLKVIFIENYGVYKAEVMLPAAELSEQISTAGMEASGTGNMKLAMNGALTIGTQDGANIEMREEVKDPWWPFCFGATVDELKGDYNPWDIYTKNPKIKRALDSLRDDTFTRTESERAALGQLFDSLMHGFGGISADRYFVLKDLESYYETQKKVEELYLEPLKWAETAIHNMAAMSTFSTDVSVEKYAKLIWDLKPCPVDERILAATELEYAQYDKCRNFLS